MVQPVSISITLSDANAGAERETQKRSADKKWIDSISHLPISSGMPVLIQHVNGLQMEGDGAGVAAGIFRIC